MADRLDLMDYCNCNGCMEYPLFTECASCGGPIIESSAPTRLGQGKGYGHTTYECDSVSCGWWWG